MVKSGSERPEHLEPCEVLVIAFNERPRRDLRARALNHVVDGDGVVLPTLAIAPVFVGDLPPFVLDAPAVPEPAELLVLGDVDPELDEQDAVRDQLLFEVPDLTVAATVLVTGRESFDALHEDPAVPAAIEDRDSPGPR